MWFSYAGEGRHIREVPLGLIDILGADQVLAPPSRRKQGYELIRGTLTDLDRLPAIKDLVRFLDDAGTLMTANREQAPTPRTQQGARGAGLLA
ncbi:hypothetical protein MLD63_06975 [Paracoccus sp. TK19116]|uniref:Uncharacterized protein n=1 Tax=Paracoccus albicereus TaxID=2922394 RepID=A0ABT1MPD6_9RHOB|nr:hypothetical protein [Paracoccus albicereus]MCQ0970160.1 hypothetical protein [Paracoccus albicereus]